MVSLESNAGAAIPVAQTSPNLSPLRPLERCVPALRTRHGRFKCLLEGCSIRSTERLTGLNRNTIMRLLLVAGEGSARLMDAKIRNVRPRYLQLDEIWTFVGKKQRHV